MDTSLAAFKEIAPYLTQPLVLVGFVLLLFFGLHRSLLKAGIIPPWGFWPKPPKICSRRRGGVDQAFRVADSEVARENQ
jgi:hypothetical protein